MRANKKPPHGAPQFPEEEYRHLRKKGEPSPRIRAWVGAYVPENSTQLKADPLTPVPARDHLHGGTIQVQPSTLLIGHLVTQLIYARVGEVGSFINSGESLGLFLPVWPPTGLPLVWPPSYVMDAAIYRAVCDMLPLT